jgi:nucleoside-diphosphate-sugar epimerase
VHLAALTSLPECESNPSECLSVNVAGTASVLKAAKDAGVKRTIVASTSAIYEGNTESEAPFAENIQVKPSLFYPLSKKLMEDVVQSYIVNYDMDIVTLRFFNVFGPRQDVHRPSPPLLNYIVKQVVKGESCTFYSNGEQKRDYVHVDDVVKLIELCINKPTARGQIYNVCTGTLTSVKDVVESAVTAFGDLQYEFRPSKEYWSSYKLSISKDAVEREVNKFSLGSCTKAMWELSWKPNKNIQHLMTETMKKNYELITR